MSAVWVSVMSGSLKSAVAVTVRPSGPEPACVAMEPSAGGRLGVCATAYRPQQATLWSDSSPHVSKPPALTWVNEPAGGDASPWALNPQQATVPSVLSLQVCEIGRASCRERV